MKLALPRLDVRRIDRDRLITAALAIATVIWLLAVEGRQGFGRDEGQYFRAGERYWGWFEELGPTSRTASSGDPSRAPVIDRYWSDNAPDHPVIMKTLYGLSWRAFHRCHCTGPTRGLHPIPVKGRHITLPLFARESTAFRFPAILFAALLVAMVYRFARGWLSRAPAAAAAVLTLAQPHYFFHAPDLLLRRADHDDGVRGRVRVLEVAAQPALGDRGGRAVRHRAGREAQRLADAVLSRRHYLWMRRGDLRARRFPRPPLAFVAMLVLGPIIFFAHWPWLWNAPVARTRAYVNRHLQHEHYNFEYLGLNWNNPPTTTARKLIRATAPFVETGVHRPGDDAGAGGGRRRRAGAAAPRAAGRRRTGPTEGPPPATRSRAGSARAPTSIGRRARSCWRRRWGRWRCSPFRRRRSSAASSTS